MGKKHLWVDMKHNAVVIPVNGEPAAFNVAVIKNVSKHEEGRFVSIRFNFHV
jgi:nucleosome binding factor SPN SPT16 subunit